MPFVYKQESWQLKIYPQEKKAAWSGYNAPYVQSIVKGILKALKLASVLTFDPGLYFWTKGLEGHLKKKMEEAKQEQEEIKKYTFS